MNKNTSWKESSIDADIDAKRERAFLGNQADLSLDDVLVQWAGESVLLWSRAASNAPLASFSSRGDRLQYKIKAWCVKNSYRASQIHDGRIWL